MYYSNIKVEQVNEKYEVVEDYGEILSSKELVHILKKYFHIQNRITWQREKGRGALNNWKNAMEDIGSTKETTIFIGDQILTDVWAAHNAGIRAILVPPINDRRDLLTRFKRVLEKPIQRKYDRIHRKDKK